MWTKEWNARRDATFSSVKIPIESSTGQSTWWMFFGTTDPPQMNDSSSASPPPPPSSPSLLAALRSYPEAMECAAWPGRPVYLPLGFSSLCLLSRDI